MRKAQAEMIEWFPRIIMILVATILIVVMVNYYSGRDVDSASVEMASQFYKIYYSNMIMYTDSSTGRIFPGVIDSSKFKDESLNSFRTNINGGKSQVASCLTLSVIGKDDKTICTNQVVVAQYVPIAQSQMTGPQAATMQNITVPVTVKDGDNLVSGKLNVITVRSNT